MEEKGDHRVGEDPQREITGLGEKCEHGFANEHKLIWSQASRGVDSQHHFLLDSHHYVWKDVYHCYLCFFLEAISTVCLYCVLGCRTPSGSKIS